MIQDITTCYFENIRKISENLARSERLYLLKANLTAFGGLPKQQGHKKVPSIPRS
jgi:hypothetical protein